MAIFGIGLEWDCVSLANKVKESFQKRGFTERDGKPLNDTMIFGMSDQGRTAFIIEGFDNKNKFGLVVTLPTDEKKIRIMGGRFNESKTLNAKYKETFTDLSEASSYFEKALDEYDKEIKN